MFTEQKFNIPSLEGISQKTMEEHLKLYAGYVKNANGIIEKMSKIDSETDPYIAGELFRRFSFEYNGMRNHEVYFSLFEGGATPLNPESELGKKLLALFGSYETFVKELQWREFFMQILYHFPKLILQCFQVYQSQIFLLANFHFV